MDNEMRTAFTIAAIANAAIAGYAYFTAIPHDTGLKGIFATSVISLTTVTAACAAGVVVLGLTHLTDHAAEKMDFSLKTRSAGLTTGLGLAVAAMVGSLYPAYQFSKDTLINGVKPEEAAAETIEQPEISNTPKPALTESVSHVKRYRPKAA